MKRIFNLILSINIFEKLAYISTLGVVEREKGKRETSKVAAAALAVNIQTWNKLTLLQKISVYVKKGISKYPNFCSNDPVSKKGKGHYVMYLPTSTNTCMTFVWSSTQCKSWKKHPICFWPPLVSFTNPLASFKWGGEPVWPTSYLGHLKSAKTSFSYGLL